jgi:uncharacterized membrane protein
MNDPNQPVAAPEKRGVLHPFRVAVFRGLAVVLPPLLTIVIFLWIGGTIEHYVVKPLTTLTRNTLVWAMSDIRKGSQLPEASQEKEIVVIGGRRYHRVGTAPDSTTVSIGGVKYRREDNQIAVPANVRSTVQIDGVTYRRDDNATKVPPKDQKYVPEYVYDSVLAEVGPAEMPRTAVAVYQRYVEITYLRTYLLIVFFTPLFILVLYLLGKFMAAGIGRMGWNLFENAIRRVPLVSNVYSPVKQVSDFLLNDRDIRASRVVAVEWPRKGVWALGLVTGESMQDIEAAANEPVLSVLVCTSPMPMTGFTVTVRKSETVDLNLSIDQAFQFVISCGVVVPQQQVRRLEGSAPTLPQLTGGNNSALAAETSKEVVEK